MNPNIVNSTIVVGTVDRDPARPQNSDATKTVASFGVSVRTTRHVESATHFEVKCQNELAENVLASVREGDEVIVVGRLQQTTWTGTRGQTSRTVLLADEIGLALSFHRINAPEGDEAA